MRLIFVNTNRLRPKLRDKINKYLSISPYNRLTVGVYKNGKAYVFGGEEENSLFYDIGSITKTFTAHLILKLHEEKMLDVYETVDSYLSLKRGKYPTIYQLLTHTAGYHHLTPIEVTLPRLITHGYARKNPYEKCTLKTVIKALITPLFGFDTFPFSIKTVPTILDASLTRSRSLTSVTQFLIIKCASSKYLLPVFLTTIIFLFSPFIIY